MSSFSAPAGRILIHQWAADNQSRNGAKWTFRLQCDDRRAGFRLADGVSVHEQTVMRFAKVTKINANVVMSKQKGITLDRALHNRFGVSALSALNITQASTLIDELKGKSPASK